MRWIDCFGAPGAGKSTLLDEAWPPGWPRPDGGGHPREWASFVACAERLLARCHGHPSYMACRGMTYRSFAKIATVHRLNDRRIYVQTGLAQRGLGFGWRLDDAEAVRGYYEIMPVSLGIVYLRCDVETLIARNIARGKNRGFMVPYIDKPCRLAAEVLRGRGVPFLEIDTTQPVEVTSARLRDFVAACAGPADAAAA